MAFVPLSCYLQGIDKVEVKALWALVAMECAMLHSRRQYFCSKHVAFITFDVLRRALTRLK
jgi:hypothetical protein